MEHWQLLIYGHEQSRPDINKQKQNKNKTHAKREFRNEILYKYVLQNSSTVVLVCVFSLKSEKHQLATNRTSKKKKIFKATDRSSNLVSMSDQKTTTTRRQSNKQKQ